MDRVKITYESGLYDCSNANSIKMYILGMFFAREVGNDFLFFREWHFDSEYTCIDGNTIELDKENGHILLRDTYSQEKIRTILKISNQQFLKLLDDWEEKVIKLQPKEVIIKYENDEFIFETKNRYIFSVSIF